MQRVVRAVAMSARAVAAPALRRTALPAMTVAAQAAPVWATAQPVAKIHRHFSTAGMTEEEKAIRDADAKAVERENATEEGIPLPVKYSGVTGRVAGGLYRVVVKNKSTEQAVATLKAFTTAVGSVDPFVARVFKSTSFSPQESLTAVAALVGVVDLSVAFDKLDEEAQALIEDAGNMKMYQEAQQAVLDGFKSIKQPADAKSLAKNDAFVAICSLADLGRLDLIWKVTAAFYDMLKVANSAVSVNIVSAVPLSKQQAARVEKIVPKYVEGKLTPLINYTVDPTVLGGVMVQVENTMADTTSDSVLRAMQQHLNL